MLAPSPTTGLSLAEAQRLLAAHGPNEIRRTQGGDAWRILWEQVHSPLVLVLLGAAAVALFSSYVQGETGGMVDAALIFAIVALSVLAGFIQDYHAEKTVESLRRMAAPQATVRRAGKEMRIPAREVVPGDIVLLEAGDVIPADGTLLVSEHLSVDESALTGESRHIEKKAGEEVYKGTTVQMGHGEMHALRTGMETKIGAIAASLQDITQEASPFQKEIRGLARIIIVFIAGLIALTFVFALRKFGFFEALLFSVSLAVAAIPEGLPAVLAVVLALGAQAMVKKRALVRRLGAVESMGEVEVVCTDKTGTLTKNEMDVVEVYGEGFAGVAAAPLSAARQLYLCGALCNNVREIAGEETTYEGSQTEIAVYRYTRRQLPPDAVEEFRREDEKPFTHERKIMSVRVVQESTGVAYLYTLGAPEVVLAKCAAVRLEDGTTMPLTDEKRKALEAVYNGYAARALRVLAAAYKRTEEGGIEEENLVWLGFFVMTDPPRAGVRQALRDLYAAHIRVVMLTGDYPVTAAAVAREIGLQSRGVVVGEEIDAMDDATLARTLREGCNIYARISPFHKLRILRQLRRRHHSVAMTGDGVNDALALKQADVGVAMGHRGTEVAREASDIILLDDHFATIRDAIREGRRAMDNIKKFINYLAVSNLAEVGVLFLATVFFSFTAPVLSPLQILWINFITDGMPAIALGLDPARRDVLRRAPRAGRPLIDRKLRWQIGLIGAKKIVILLATFLLVWYWEGFAMAATALFTGFILYEFVRIATIRAQEHMPLWTNRWLLGALAVSLLLQLAVLYTPLARWFGVVPLSAAAWLVLAGGVVVGYFLARWIVWGIERLLPEADAAATPAAGKGGI